MSVFLNFQLVILTFSYKHIFMVSVMKGEYITSLINTLGRRHVASIGALISQHVYVIL